MEPAEFQGTPRFEIRELLGAGGMGKVYRAYDRERKTIVALKTLRDRDPQSLYRFKQEFRALADLEHPNLIRLGELFCEQDQWFFTMDLLRGTDFVSHVRLGLSEPADDRPADADASTDATLESQRAAVAVRPVRGTGFDEAKLRHVLRQLAAAVCALHAANIVHRDVKPSNIIVTPEQRAVLLDFGLATEVVAGGQITDVGPRGTVLYMAPEQANGERVGPPADWYAVGVILHEALTGRVPFTGSVLQVLVDKARIDPPAPRDSVPGVPDDLSALCVDLLERRPEDRPTGPEVLARLGAVPAEAFRKEAISLSPGVVEGAPFVGRSNELAALLDGVRESIEGRAVTLLVRGESGVGKSALVRKLIERVRTDPSDPLVLTGRCFERESVPFKAIDGIIDALSRHLSQLDQVVAAMLLSQDAALPARIFPVLRRVPAMAHVNDSAARLADPIELRTRAFAALRGIFSRLCGRQPVVLFIDDFQWADAESLRLIREVMHPPDPPPFCLIAAMRLATESSSGARSSAPTAADLVGPVREFVIDVLPPRDAFELAKQLLASTHQSDVDPGPVAREAHGHPLFIDELVRHLQTEGTAAKRPTIVRLDDAVWFRIGRLDAPARHLLEVLAVAGAPVTLATAAQSAEMELAEFIPMLATLRASQFARSTGVNAADTVETYHDRIREAVLANVTAETRKAHHRRLANALEGAGAATTDPHVLVRHLEAAGDSERAAHLAERSARLADEALAFEMAANLYRTALRLGAYKDAALRRVRMGLADALAHAAQTTGAADAYLLAAEGADPALALECQRRAAEQLLFGGHLDRGFDVLKIVLSAVGIRLPATQRAALLSFMWQRIKIRVRGLGWKERPASEIPAQDAIRLEVYQAVSRSLGLANPILAADFQARGLLLALRTGARSPLVMSVALEAIYVSTSGARAKARAHHFIAIGNEIAGRGDIPEERALLIAAAGVVSALTGDFPIAAQQLAQAEDALHSSGASPLTRDARLFRLLALRQLGAHAQVRILFDEYVRDAARRGDRYTEITLTRSCNIVWLVANDPARARADLRGQVWQTPDKAFYIQHWYEMKALAEIELYEGTAGATLDDLREKFQALAASLALRVQMTIADALWLRGRLALAAAEANRDSERALREALAMARRLDGEGVPYASAWALLLRAGAAFRSGDRKDAIAQLEAAASMSEKYQLKTYRAIALLRLGELLEGPAAEAHTRDAHQSLASEGVRNPQRMAALIAPGFAAPRALGTP